MYQRTHAAERKVQQLLDTDGIEFTVCTSSQIHFVSPHDFDDDNESEDWTLFNE